MLLWKRLVASPLMWAPCLNGMDGDGNLQIDGQNWRHGAIKWAVLFIPRQQLLASQLPERTLGPTHLPGNNAHDISLAILSILYNP